jgi:hypothetical protein
MAFSPSLKGTSRLANPKLREGKLSRRVFDVFKGMNSQSRVMAATIPNATQSKMTVNFLDAGEPPGTADPEFRPELK